MWWYFAFWIAGCNVGGGIAWIAAKSRGAPSVRSAVVIVISVLAFAWGTRAQYLLEVRSPIGALFFRPADVFQAGHHLPLGLAAGAAAGAVTSIAVGVPWSTSADALALGAAAMMAIGRIGCFVNGCCTGTACPTRSWPLCVRYDVAKRRHTFPLLSGAPERAASGPWVHPLPLYFACASAAMAGMFAVLLWNYRIRSGVVAATFTTLYPGTQLFLEHFRGSTGGHPESVMLDILLLELLGGAVFLLRCVTRKV